MVGFWGGVVDILITQEWIKLPPTVSTQLIITDWSTKEKDL